MSSQFSKEKREERARARVVYFGLSEESCSTQNPKKRKNGFCFFHHRIENQYRERLSRHAQHDSHVRVLITRGGKEAWEFVCVPCETATSYRGRRRAHRTRYFLVYDIAQSRLCTNYRYKIDTCCTYVLHQRADGLLFSCGRLLNLCCVSLSIRCSVIIQIPVYYCCQQ